MNPMPRYEDATWLAEEGRSYSIVIDPRGVVTCIPNSEDNTIVGSFTRAVMEENAQ